MTKAKTLNDTMTTAEYEKAKERLGEIESEAEYLYDELDTLQAERSELEEAIERYEEEQAALDE